MVKTTCMVLVLGDNPMLASTLADYIAKVLSDRRIEVEKGKYLMDEGHNMTLPGHVFIDIHVIKREG